MSKTIGAASSSNAPLSSILCGVSGEYFVAAELSRRGYIASLTLRNTRGIDILASNVEATRSVGIQVKTGQGAERSWLVGRHVEEGTAENLFFVFVRLNSGGAPAFHVVPRAEVARFAGERYRRWLKRPGRRGQAHDAANPIRKFQDPNDEYLDRWELLGL